MTRSVFIADAERLSDHVVIRYWRVVSRVFDQARPKSFIAFFFEDQRT